MITRHGRDLRETLHGAVARASLNIDPVGHQTSANPPCVRTLGCRAAVWFQHARLNRPHRYILLPMPRFRRFRRLMAGVANLLLVHLAFASSAVACPFGDGVPQAADATASSKALSHEHHHRMNGGGREGPDAATSAPSPEGIPSPSAPHHHAGAHCDMACPPSSCGSAGHCLTAAKTSSTSPTAFVNAQDSLIVVGLATTPRSVSTAPEPPPPRA
jgi:hypothetical protein